VDVNVHNQSVRIPSKFLFPPKSQCVVKEINYLIKARFLLKTLPQNVLR
jgi:hypothetical protein